MRNYVIINGVNSLTINGLAINELPAISKPPMRVYQEEIDGRDGDITTNLGYGAYDKIMTIGLYDGYDIDEIIAFFNKEGTVTFSNEDDKYYNYKIIEQIDYEKLLKFKTATITLHCQPFKYPINETPVEIAYQYVEGTGETLTLENTAEAQMTLDLLGNTQQDSTSISGGDEYDSPSPDHPQPIHTCSGDNTIKVEGKNLWNENTQVFTSQSRFRNDGKDSNNVWTFTIAGSDGYSFATSNITLQAGTYCVSANVDNGNFIILKGNVTQTIPFTLTEETTITFRVYKNGVVGDVVKLSNVMIERGSTATSYEPYTSQSYLISLGDIELCKIGTYQDKIYKDNGKWYLHKEIKKYTSCIRADITTNAYRFLIKPNSELHDMTSSTSVGTPALTNCIGIREPNPSFLYNYGWGGLVLYIGNKSIIGDYSDADLLKQWFDNNVIAYVGINADYDTPTNTEITDSTLLETLENIYSMTGTTNISQENNDLPFTINAKALMQGSGTATINNIGNVYSKPTLDIVGNGVVNVAINGNQLLSVNVTDEIVIDSTNLEAYDPNTQELMNRQVTGNISNLKLEQGESTITISGDSETSTVTDYVRWL